jgi:fatty acid desaturase
VLLTHGSLALLTAAPFMLLLVGPVWLTFLPCVIVGHRVGVLRHEYIHGIPFRRYRDNLRVVGVFDGLLLMFGLLELFRGTHLAHHRWLNAPGDPGFHAATELRSAGWVGRRLLAIETVQYFRFLRGVLRGRHPYVRPNRIARGGASCAFTCLHTSRWDPLPLVHRRSSIGPESSDRPMTDGR